MHTTHSTRVVLGLLVCSITSVATAEVHTTGIPALNSRPGATYELYLNFGGFNFTGTWGATGLSPGNVQAYENTTGVFDPSQQNSIQEIWARVAQKYTPFDINITTIDPAVAAQQADTDAQRQAYYDQTPGLMHTVIANGTWFGASGGASYLGVVADSWTTDIYNGGSGAGWHTNWVFPNYTGTSKQNIGEATAHEIGHGLNLLHQSDYNGDSEIKEYSSGNNTYAPIMGKSYNALRGTWRLGDDGNGNIQNDPAVIAANAGINGYVDDGIGHTLSTATPLPLTGDTVDFSAAQGVIVPLSISSPDPIGAAHYTSDYFSFFSDGQSITLTVNNGTQFLQPGIADPGVTLRSTLQILDRDGNWVASGTESPSTLSVTFSGTMDTGEYFAVISSYGGSLQTLSNGFITLNTTKYYDMGSYFLTGTGFSVIPEPATAFLLVFPSIICLLCIRPAETRGRPKVIIPNSTKVKFS